MPEKRSFCPLGPAAGKLRKVGHVRSDELLNPIGSRNLLEPDQPEIPFDLGKAGFGDPQPVAQHVGEAARRDCASRILRLSPQLRLLAL